jgi:hypothetical protein
VISTANAVEIRRYEPMIIAEVEVRGKRRDAVGNGFRQLADYIFGNNTRAQDIAMTAPVQQREGESIAMTAPVQQEGADGEWNVSFVMPSQYTMQSLPKPNNKQVMLKEVPAQYFVAIQFSGRSSDDNVAEHEAQLKEYILANNLQAIGMPKYAFYNPPWTLPFMRRNEVMFAIVMDEVNE